MPHKMEMTAPLRSRIQLVMSSPAIKRMCAVLRRQHRGRRSLKAEIRRAVRKYCFYDREVKEFINLLDLHPYWQGEVLYDRFGTGSFAIEDRQIVMNSLNIKSSRWGSELSQLLQATHGPQPQLKIFRGN